MEEKPQDQYEITHKMESGFIYKANTRRDKFTDIPNDLIRDKNIPSIAKAVLFWFLSHDQQNFRIRLTQLHKHFYEGRDAIKTAFNYLVDNGYILKVEVIRKDGQFDGYNFVVYEEPSQPRILSTDISGNPLPFTENPSTVSQVGFKNTNNKKENNKKKEPDEKKKADIVSKDQSRNLPIVFDPNKSILGKPLKQDELKEVIVVNEIYNTWRQQAWWEKFNRKKRHQRLDNTTILNIVSLMRLGYSSNDIEKAIAVAFQSDWSEEFYDKITLEYITRHRSREDKFSPLLEKFKEELL